MFRKNFFYLLLSAVMLVAYTGCKDDDPYADIKQNYWISSQEYTPTTPPTAASIKGLATIMAAADPTNAALYTKLAGLVEYDVKLYRTKYKTAFRGDTITASGLVCVPVSTDKKAKFPIVSFQHGTIARKSEAPSVTPMGEANVVGALMASTGMIVLMPDYIGFGESSQHFHPYLHKEYTNNAVLDFIRAGKEFIIIDQPANWNDKLFLAGYSQGGSATLGALSAIENNSSNADIKVTATSCGAGAYNLNVFRNWLVTQMNPNLPQRYEQPWFLAYLMESFSKYANVTTPYAHVFHANVATKVPGIIDGQKTGGEINAQFPQSIGQLLNDDFLNNEVYQTGSTYASLRKAFADNSIEAWSLKSKVAFYYGDKDAFVPSLISLTMISEFQSIGASANVLPRPLQNLTHETAAIPTIIGTIEWFKTF